MKNIIIAIEKISATDVADLLLKYGNVTFETNDGDLVMIERQKRTRIYAKEDEAVILETLVVFSSVNKDSQRVGHQYFFIEDSKSAIDSFIKRSESKDPHKPFGQLLTLDDLFQEHKLSLKGNDDGSLHTL